MFGHRRQLAREALDRLESRELGARLGEEGALAELARLQARDVELGRRMRGMQQRLDDANAELRRWGLEPVLRDEAESGDHPTRYRRSSDWRLTDFAHVSAAIEAIAPDGVDVTVRDGDRDATPEEAARDRELGFLPRYESDAPAVAPLEAPIDDRLAALRRMRDDALTAARELAVELERVRAELADALTAAREAEAAVRNGATGLADALAEERTEREQAERSRDRAQGRSLDLERWLEAHVAALGAFVDALTDAHQRGTLHVDLVAPFERAVALLANPDA